MQGAIARDVVEILWRAGAPFFYTGLLLNLAICDNMRDT